MLSKPKIIYLSSLASNLVTKYEMSITNALAVIKAEEAEIEDYKRKQLERKHMLEIKIDEAVEHILEIIGF